MPDGARLKPAVVLPASNVEVAPQRQLRNHNGWQAAGVLLFLAVFLGALLVVPSLRRAPAPDVLESGPSR